MSHKQRSDSAEENRGRLLPTLPPSSSRQTETARTPNRLIAPHMQTAPPETRDAIQRYVKDGLAKVLRRSNDPNRIDIVIPDLFMRTPQATMDQGSSLSTPSEPVMAAGEASKLADVAHPIGDNVGVQVTLDVDSIVGSPMSILDEGRIDPFAIYPIKMSKGEHWLMDQVNISEELRLKNLRERWLPLAINDSGAFHQFLSNVALNISILHGGERNGLVSVAHHSLAVRITNQQLSDPLMRTSNGIIASIVEFACYSINHDDLRSCKIHFDGLESIIRMRGGLSSLNNYNLSILIYSVDISAACRFDIKPRFPIPEEVSRNYTSQILREQTFRRELSEALLPWQKLLPTDSPLIEIFDGIYDASIHAKFVQSIGEVWMSVEYILYRVDPLIHKLLSQDTENDNNNPENLLHDMCRLGICIFLCPLRRNCGKLGVSGKIYVKKLKALLSSPSNANVIKLPRQFMLWILFFGMLESGGLPEEKWFLASLVKTASGFKLAWDDLLEIVSSFLWMDTVFVKELENAKSRYALKLEAF